MQCLDSDQWEEVGCFVYQVIDALEVRKEPSIDDSHRTGMSFNAGELVSVDLVLPEDKETGSGPYLRLSNHKGWLFVKKNQEGPLMKRMKVISGLWTVVVDNFPAGQALREHPVDRSDVKLRKGTLVVYKPMQKIYCDKMVKHPNSGATFFRVQGTNGWVFDKRASEDDDFTSMLLEESKVKTGLFAYRALRRLGIRNKTTVGDESKTGDAVDQDEVIAVDVVRESPYRSSNNGPFLRLADGSGWLFESKYGKRYMEALPVERGAWTLKVLNPAGIALRRQPMDRRDIVYDKTYAPNTIVRCDRKISSPTGVNFYRVVETNGWIFDKRNDHDMLELVSAGAAVSSPLAETRSAADGGWSPEFVRGVAVGVDGLQEIFFNEQSRVISFQTSDGARINVYYSTKTIGTALNHPSQGKTQMFRRNCTSSDLANIMKNPRVHTGRGYQQKCARTLDENPANIVQSPLGPGILVEQEEEIRNEVLEYDKELEKLQKQRQQALKRLKTYDDTREKEARNMNRRFKAFEDARKEARALRALEDARKEARALRALEDARKEARALEQRKLQERTCSDCDRVFANVNALQQHNRAVHSFECEYCYRVFKTRHALNQHCNDLGHW